jgi:hypothetical protein
MTLSFPKQWTIPVLAITLAALTTLNVLPYGGNITSFFHMDHVIADAHPLPKNFVSLQVPSYDGAQYYQVARNMPIIFSHSRWDELRDTTPSSYAYQRFLLPLLAFIVSFGQDGALPYAFLALNLGSLLLAAWIVLKATGKPLYALALGLSPAAMVALHFSLAEPLTILLLTWFLVRYAKNGTLEWIDLLPLSLAVLTREVNILFIGLLGVYSLFKGKWADAFVLCIPVGAFLALHGLLFWIFHSIPFFESAGKRTLPFEAMYQLVTGGYGYNRLTVTSIPLAVLFVIPAIAWCVSLVYERRDLSFLAFGSLGFLALMTTMPDHIWGSITSIGRVITPVYPLAILLAAKHDTLFAKYLTIVVLVIGLGAGVTLALIKHPFMLA